MAWDSDQDHSDLRAPFFLAHILPQGIECNFYNTGPKLAPPVSLHSLPYPWLRGKGDQLWAYREEKSLNMIKGRKWGYAARAQASEPGRPEEGFPKALAPRACLPLVQPLRLKPGGAIDTGYRWKVRNASPNRVSGS